MQVNGEAQNLTPTTPKPRMRKSYKWAEVITPWTPTPVQKFVTIRPGVSFPRMRDFARQIAHQKVLGFFWFLQLATAKIRKIPSWASCFWFVQLATAKAPGHILTQNAPKLAVLLLWFCWSWCSSSRISLDFVGLWLKLSFHFLLVLI